MRKGIASLFLAAVLAIVLGAVAFADDSTIVASGDCGANGDNVTWTLDSNGLLTISGQGEMGSSTWADINSEIKTVSIEHGVTSIGYGAFSDCSSLTNVMIPDSVTTIYDSAFFHCSSLTSVTIPNSVTSIENYAFYGCSSLTSITMPSYIAIIGERTFSDCSSLSDLTIPDSVISIGSYAFSGCSSLTSVIIPDSVTTIGNSAFYDCRGLTSVKISDSVISIEGFAFSSCGQLTNVSIPSTVTSIECGVFNNCRSLASITIPSNVTSIGDSAFAGCSSLTSVTIPDSVTSIGDSAFGGCSSLSSVTIPDCVTSIGDDAFSGCRSLTRVTIPDSVTSIGDGAFFNCSSLTSISLPRSIARVAKELFHGCISLTSVTIPNSVTSIGDGAFGGCSSLSSVTIPNSVTSIGDGAFGGCRSLSSVTIPGSVTSIGIRVFSGCDSLTTATFGKGVTSIGECLFSGCSNLTSITIPNSVTSIGYGAFSDCSSLSSVTFPSGVTSIEREALAGCSSLTSVVIPNSIRVIKADAFASCSKLGTVYYGGTEPQWLQINVNSGNSSIKKAAVYFSDDKFIVLTAVPDYLASTGKPYIKWKAVDGAAKYEVYRSTSETGTFKWMGTTTQPNYTDTSAKSGSYYYYRVRPVGSKYSVGNMSAPVRATCRCGKPKLNKAQYLTASGKPYLTWPSVDGVAKYKVYRAGSKNGTYKLLGTTTGMSYTDASAYAGYTYYYKIKAVCMGNSAATSAYSATVSAVSHCARPVAKSDYLTSTGKPYVKWSAVTGASKYQVYRSTSKTGTYKLLGTTTKLNYKDTTATTGYTYYYKVKAVSKVKTSANSAYSTPISIICHCAKPVVKITTSNGDPKLTWNTVTGASKYEVYRATSQSGTYTKMFTTTKTSYTNTSAKAGTTYYYKVKAVSKVKTSANSAYSAVKSIKAK